MGHLMGMGRNSDSGQLPSSPSRSSAAEMFKEFYQKQSPKELRTESPNSESAD